MMRFNKIVGISVGTDVSRPRPDSRCPKDVIHRSLQTTYPHSFIKEHYYALVPPNYDKCHRQALTLFTTRFPRFTVFLNHES